MWDYSLKLLSPFQKPTALKYLLPLLYLSFSFPLLAQEYLFLDRAEIKSYFESNATFQDREDCLLLTLFANEKEDSVKACYYFDAEGLCDSVVCQFYCSLCFDEFIGQLTTDQDYQWRQLGDHHFLSARKEYQVLDLPGFKRQIGSIALKIEDAVDPAYCKTATYTLFVTDAKTWRRLTHPRNRLREAQAME